MGMVTVKSDYNYISPQALRAVCDIFSTCAKGRPHWVIHNTSQTDDISAALRHLESHRAGDYMSEEGHSHLAHAVTRLFMALDKYMRNGPEATVWNGELRGDSPARDADGQPSPAPGAESASGGGRESKSIPTDTAFIVGALLKMTPAKRNGILRELFDALTPPAYSFRSPGGPQ